MELKTKEKMNELEGNIQIHVKPEVDGLEFVLGKTHYVTTVFDEEKDIEVKGYGYGQEESLTNAIIKYVEQINQKL